MPDVDYLNLAVALLYLVLIVELLVLAYRSWFCPSPLQAHLLGPICLVFAMNAIRFLWYWSTGAVLGTSVDLLVRNEWFVLPSVLVMLVVVTIALIESYSTDGKCDV